MAKRTSDQILVVIWIAFCVQGFWIQIQEFLKVFFIYYCDSDRQPTIILENPWQRSELSQCF